MDGPNATLRRRRLFARFWRSAAQFWTKQSRREAWFLTLALLTFILGQIFIQYRLNVWNKNMFDALEKKLISQVAELALLFVPLALAAVAFNVASVWGRMTTQRAWRAWLTDNLLDRWFRQGRYYQLNLVSGDHSNPEARITEDTRVATESPVDFVYGVTTALLTAATFIGVLWNVGGRITFEIFGRTITIPGYLVLAAVSYAICTTIIMLFIARRFVPVAESRNQAEAEFRYAATRVRENGESIALLGGEPEERSSLSEALGVVILRWRDACLQFMRTTVVSYSNFVIAPVVPLILCAPKYLSGTLSLGEVMQATTAFVTVQQSLNWLVENYPKLADWTAAANRVAALMVALDHLERAEKNGFGRIERRSDETLGDNEVLKLNQVSVALDDGTEVVSETEFVVAPGEQILVTGESGAGKSTLVRAIAGLWPWGDGEIIIHRDARLFFMPQRPYVPVGTLKRAVAYPNSVDDLTDEEVKEALVDAELGHLSEKIADETIPWEKTLSGGEQQRLAFAQLFVQKPSIIVMDEATSALDPITQERLLLRMQEKLPKASLISVGHRTELEEFHNRRLVLARASGGARLVSDEPLVPVSAMNRFWARLLLRNNPRAE